MIEAMKMYIANRIPRWLAYWCAIRVMSHATMGQYSSQIVPDLRATEALQRWDA